MTHIMKIDEFVNESAGTPLSMRTSDRFEDDPLVKKSLERKRRLNAGGYTRLYKFNERMKQRIFDFIHNEMKPKYSNEFFELKLNKCDFYSFVNKNYTKITDTSYHLIVNDWYEENQFDWNFYQYFSNDVIIFKWKTLNRSQINALNHLGNITYGENDDMYISLTDEGYRNILKDIIKNKKMRTADVNDKIELTLNIERKNYTDIHINTTEVITLPNTIDSYLSNEFEDQMYNALTQLIENYFNCIYESFMYIFK